MSCGRCGPHVRRSYAVGESSISLREWTGFVKAFPQQPFRRPASLRAGRWPAPRSKTRGAAKRLLHKNAFENVTPLIQLLVGQRQRRQQANDRAVRAVDEQPAVETSLDERRALDGQLDADHS